MRYRITGQLPLGVWGEYPDGFIEFVDVDQIIEATDEYEALEKAPATGSELYLCRDLVIQPVEAGPGSE